MSRFIQTSYKTIWIFNNGDTWSLGCKSIKRWIKQNFDCFTPKTLNATCRTGG